MKKKELLKRILELETQLANIKNIKTDTTIYSNVSGCGSSSHYSSGCGSSGCGSRSYSSGCGSRSSGC